MGGAVFEGSIQTPLVRAESGNDLRYEINSLLSGRIPPNIKWINEANVRYYNFNQRLESATRTLQMQAPQGVALESQAGDISATSYEDLRLWSTGGSVLLDF